MFCPEGSSRPSGVGECPSGSYCPAGIRFACPVGTYCPREGHWDPMPCPPGEFSAMVGQEKCTSCPRGYICPGFGRIDPTPCPSGMVCSRISLTSPNQRCPPGKDGRCMLTRSLKPKTKLALSGNYDRPSCRGSNFQLYSI